jgi:hypothetical protein
VIAGKISGVRGKPPAHPRVDVFNSDRFDAPRRIDAAEDGSFSVTTSQPGVVRLSFAGALHESYSFPLLLLNPSKIRIEVRLAPYEWEREFRELIVIGDFNAFSRTTGYVVMVKQPDSTYAAELGNIAGEKMGYRLIGLVKGSPRSVPGTQFDDLITDPTGNYISLVTVRNGKVRIVFDPALLPRGAAEAGVTFLDGDPELVRIAALDVEMRRRQSEYSRALAQFRAFGNKDKDFRYDWSKAAAGLRQQLRAEKNPSIRQALWISLLDLTRLRSPDVTAETARQALAAIPPDSRLWEIAPETLLFETVRLAGGLAQYAEYFQAVVTRHPSREVRALALEQAYLDAMSTLDLQHAREYYHRLTGEFSDLAPGQRVKSRPPELRIAAGKMMPEFVFTSMDDPVRTINNATFKGKCYLIEFWAAWSAPAVAQMEALHRTFENYQKKGFEILSLSFDAVPEDVQRFRARHWKMPWYHGFIGRDEFRAGSRISDYFEVPALPKAILVDRNGRIAAVGDDLIGEKLGKQVGRLAGNCPSM